MNKTLTSQILMTIALLINSRAIAQPGSQNFDKVWVQGQVNIFSTVFNGQLYPNNKVDTTQINPPYLTGGGSNICDINGYPSIICNGYTLYNKDFEVVQNGDTIVPHSIYSFHNGYSQYKQSSIILPFANGKYKIVTPTASDSEINACWKTPGICDAVFDQLLYTEVDMKANGGKGRVTRKMIPLLQGVSLSKTQMMACRHGDDKSWWLVKPGFDTTLFYKFLITDDTIYGPYIQGFQKVQTPYRTDICGQAMFSQDGTKYATVLVGYGQVFMADFDRCTGNFFNPKIIPVPLQPTHDPFRPNDIDSSTTGVCFSPNGRYLYVASFCNIQQLDLQNPNPVNGWTQLSGPDTAWQEFQSYDNIYSGPDNKLYIGNWDGLGGQMSVINSPDNAGTAADFCPKCLRFPAVWYGGQWRYIGVGGPPCMPNYHLGAVSTPCAPAGVKEQMSKAAQFTLYPNPAQGVIEVQYEEAGTLLLYDMTSRMVATWPLPVSVSGKKSIVLNELSAGVYQYKYVSKQSGAFKAGKLVITR